MANGKKAWILQNITGQGKAMALLKKELNTLELLFGQPQFDSINCDGDIPNCFWKLLEKFEACLNPVL